MLSPEKNVALVSRTQAEKYFQKENFGRAFAHILLTLKLCPNWKNDMKELFTTSLCNWGEELEDKGRYSDLFNCYEQALEVYPDNVEVINNLGAHLFRTGHLNEASFYFKKALKIKSDYVPAYRNLQSLSNLLVERWHFRMLNDAHRNEAYREAVFKKISQGFDFVLDIGTGTGLLSYFAVDSGARNVFACDYSQTMIDTANKISNCNGLEVNIKFICKLSNDLTIPDDIPRRVSLVVTETMDAGLFGEHLIQTLLHAWKFILLPPLPPASLVPPVPCIICRDVESCQSTRRNGIVVPFGASLWFSAIECSSIGKKYRVVSDKRTCFINKKFPFLLNAVCDEPYDCENLKMILNKCKFLCEPINCLYVNFNDVKELQDYFDGKYDDRVYNVKCSCVGALDFFVFWFDLHLDEDIKLSSSPFISDENSDSCCWDQAIFPVKNHIVVSAGSSIDVKVKTKSGKLGLEICTIYESRFLDTTSEVLNVSQDAIRYFNNSSLMRSLDSAADTIKNKNIRILDFSPFPVLYLDFIHDLSTSGSSCTFVAKTMNEINLLEKLMVVNGINLNCIKCVQEKDFKASLQTDCSFDLIITNLLDSTGELKESSIDQLPKLSKLLTEDGKILPERISLWGQLISSKWLKSTAEVLNEGSIKKFCIADFINKHKASQQVDLCMASIEHRILSEEFQILELTMDDLINKTCKEFHINIPVTASGEATAIVYWYQCQLIADCAIFSTKDGDSNINQVAVMIEQNREVISGDTIKFSGKFSDAGFIFNIE